MDLIQQLTPEQMAWIMQVAERTVDTWLGGKKKKPLITHFKLGGVRRISPEAAQQFIFDHTIQAVAYRIAGLTPRLADEDMELLCSRMQRFIETQIASALSYKKEAA